MKHYNIPIFISHFGCPNACVFCNQKKINGRETDVTMEDVRKIIEMYLETLPKNSKKEVAFFGGTFTGISLKLQKEYLETVYEYIKKGLIDGIRPVSYTHLTLPTTCRGCRSRWSPYH